MRGWRAVATADGSPTLASAAHGQACHSLAGAWTEARLRYAEPARVASLAAGGRRVRLLDVASGLGWNLAAALEAAERGGGALDAVCLESDALVIASALELASPAGSPWEPWWSRVRRALAAALLAPLRAETEGVSLGGASRARLLMGDARERIRDVHPGARFDAVLLDPFSPAVEDALWEAAFLADVAARMERGARLTTYTTSLGVRTALAAAGLEVGCGPAVGAKSAGTLAARGAAVPPLPARTERKLARRLERARGGAAGADRGRMRDGGGPGDPGRAEIRPAGGERPSGAP
jgi:hypothetical protein